jgi:hypothetical protein
VKVLNIFHHIQTSAIIKIVSNIEVKMQIRNSSFNKISGVLAAKTDFKIPEYSPETY